MIGTAHAAKQKADKNERYLRPQDRILGSTALFGYTDTQMYLAAPDETGSKDGVYTFFWNPHHAPPAAFPLTRDSEGRFVIAEGTGTSAAPSILGPPALTPHAEKLLELFHPAGTPTTRGELAQQTSTWLAPRDLHAALTILSANHLILPVPLASGQWTRTASTH